MKQHESPASGVMHEVPAGQGFFPRRAVLSFACGLTLAACASVPEPADGYVALESSKFT